MYCLLRGICEKLLRIKLVLLKKLLGTTDKGCLVSPLSSDLCLKSSVFLYVKQVVHEVFFLMACIDI